MISLLNFINDNILLLSGWLKDIVTQEEEEGKDRDKARLEEKSFKANIYTG